MSQIEREYKDALDGLRFSGEAKARMVKRLTEQKEEKPVRRRTRPLRMGLIAAAACLALAGTAFAATTVYNLVVKTYDSWMHHDEEIMRFELCGEAGRFTLKDFSRQLQDDYSASLNQDGLTSQLFDDWESAKAYIGDNIPCTWRDTSGTVSERKYGVQAIPDMSGETANLQHVAFDSVFSLPEGQAAEVVIYIYGEGQPVEYLYGMAAPLGTDVQVLDSYLMANGCAAQVIAQVSPPDPNGNWAPSYCIGFFVKDGILYEVSMYGGNLGEIPMSQLENRLHQVLDTFY